jgi:hypothetical protein
MSKKTTTKPVLLEPLEQEELLGAMRSLWEYIGGDAEAACQEAGERLTNACAIEFVLDAGRLEERLKGREDKALAYKAYQKLKAASWGDQMKWAKTHCHYA